MLYKILNLLFKKNKAIALDYVNFRNQMSLKATVLDIRTKEAFDSGHILYAINIDFSHSDLSKHLQKLAKSKVYLIYAENAQTSQEAAQTMVDKNFRKIYYLSDGLNEWTGNLVIS